MDAYFAFTDECGNYQKIRSAKYNRSHPFYVRATVIISLADYLTLQAEMDKIKAAFGLQSKIEVKWAHYGSALKNNYRDIPHSLSPEQLRAYFTDVITCLAERESVEVYYTLTDNRQIGQVEEVSLIKMHLQNAYQKIQTTLSERDGYAIVVADDLNDKTKLLKKAVYSMTMAGDYVQYTNIKKGLYIDFSDQCNGLQVADICAGAFTAASKYVSAEEKEKHKFQFGHQLLLDRLYARTRYGFYHPPTFDIYKYGVKEVPNGKGEDTARKVSKEIADKMYNDLMRELFG